MIQSPLTKIVTVCSLPPIALAAGLLYLVALDQGFLLSWGREAPLST